LCLRTERLPVYSDAVKIILFIISVVYSLIIVINAASNGATPGIKLTITQSTLTYITNQVVPVIEKQIQTLNIPDHTEDVDTPIGKVQITASNIKIVNFQLAKAILTVVPVGLQVNIVNCQTAVTLNWHYKEKSWPHISGSGTADVKISINLGLLVAITIGPDGKPVVNVPSIQADITNFDLHLHGGASWLYNIFIGIFKGTIKKSIQEAIQKNLSQVVVQNVAKILSTINLKYPIRDGIYVDLSFDEMTFQASSYMVTGNVGEIVYQNGSRYPGQSIALPDFDPKLASSMIQISLSDYVLNSAAWAAFQAERSSIVINAKNVPPMVAPLFNTTAFTYFIPQLAQKFPAMAMQITFAVAAAPTFKINPTNGCEISVEGVAQFQVIQPSGEIVTAFTLDLTSIMDVLVSINASKIVTASMTYKNSALTLKQSIVGQFDVSELNLVITATFKYVVVPLFNIATKDGFRIPTAEGITLVNPAIQYSQDFIQIYSNIIYTPSFI
jgi:lipopolysaccharide-binding protein